jgi:hypothetical protein
MHIKILTLAAITTLLAACSGIPVSQDYDTNANFSNLHSYRWSEELLQKENQVEGNDPLLNSRIHKAVDRKLAAMGLALVENGSSDFIVSYQMQVSSKLEPDGTTSTFSLGFGSFGHFGGVGIASGSQLREQDEAVLMIDFIDSASHKLLWRGLSSRYVYTHNEPDELTRIVNEHVDAILAQFPPGAKPQ